MEALSKKVSLEPITSRFPVLYPSLKKGKVCFIQPDSTDNVGNAFYGAIPLGVNEGICGEYINFTPEMDEMYHGKTIHYYELQKWMNKFNHYYSLVRSSECRDEFSSVSDFYLRTFPDGVDIAEAERLDTEFTEHGGEAFYNWLIDNYFAMLDLKREYNVISSQCTYLEWLTFVNNLGRDCLYYPDVIQFYGKMLKWSKLNCNDPKNCCDCSDFKGFGGSLMLTVLSTWVQKIQSNILKINTHVSSLGYKEQQELIPKFYFNIPIKSKIEDLGTYVSFSKEFVPGRKYIKGEVCSYDNDVYILENEDSYNDMSFNKTVWSRYYDVFKSKKENEQYLPYAWHSTELLSGWTVSSLNSFIRKEDTVDGIGNTLPGYFEPYSGSTFVQPAENSILDFMYVPGTTDKLTFLMEEYGKKIYTCDLLLSIRFYYKDLEGAQMAESVATIGDDILLKIGEASEKANMNMIHGRPNDGNIYADFTYLKNTMATYNENGDIKSYGDGQIWCTDHCTIELSTCQYYLSQTEFYPLRYYKVNQDIQTRYSDENQAYVDVAMCEWKFNPEVSGKDNVYTATPLLMKEEFTPFQMVENTVDNIYIDRGYATILDRHLRIGEIRNYDQLEKYGNGIFQILNADEEVV